LSKSGTLCRAFRFLISYKTKNSICKTVAFFSSEVYNRLAERCAVSGCPTLWLSDGLLCKATSFLREREDPLNGSAGRDPDSAGKDNCI
jgi:hypothetical protein